MIPTATIPAIINPGVGRELHHCEGHRRAGKGMPVSAGTDEWIYILNVSGLRQALKRNEEDKPEEFPMHEEYFTMLKSKNVLNVSGWGLLLDDLGGTMFTIDSYVKKIDAAFKRIQVNGFCLVTI